MNNGGGATLGQFIAARLVEVGCTDYFGVPGDTQTPAILLHVSIFAKSLLAMLLPKMLLLAYSLATNACRRL